MNMDRTTLRQIDKLQQPRNLFVLPEWAKPEILDRLIQGGYVTFSHLQRSKGVISLVTGLQLTSKGQRKTQSSFDWARLAIRGSLAGVSFTAMSAVLFYVG